MKTLKFAAILTAGATLALSHIPSAAQAAANPVSLGVKIQVKPEGAEIVEMLPGRTAAAAGFKVGDILLEAGGKPISPEVLQEYLKQAKVGDQLSFKVKRADAVVELSGNAVATPEGEPAPPAQPQQ